MFITESGLLWDRTFISFDIGQLRDGGGKNQADRSRERFRLGGEKELTHEELFLIYRLF